MIVPTLPRPSLLRWLIPVCLLTLAILLAVPNGLTSLLIVPQPGVYGLVALGGSCLLVCLVRRDSPAGLAESVGRTMVSDAVSVELAAGLISRPESELRAGARTRVLHLGKFYPPHMGGIETHLQVLCEGLRGKFALEVVVASENSAAIEENIGGVAVSRLPARATVLSTPICPSMIRRIRDCSDDIVHLHLPNPAAAAAWLASSNRAKLVVTYHSDIVRQRYVGKLVEPILRAVLARSSAIIVTSPQMIQTSPILADYQDRCHVIPFGIPLDQFTKCDPRSVRSIREEHGERLILSVGRLVYYKGFEYLIRAMQNVQGKLLIVGQGPLRPKLEKLIVDLGVSDKVTLLGSVPDAVPYYHSADVFALASVARSEAFGIVQIEAMAAGLPVVNTNLQTGVPYVSLHGKTGLTVPPADADALASALNLLLDNPQLRDSLGTAARRRAQTEFSEEIMVGRVTHLYEQLMNQDGKMSDARTQALLKAC